jgi:hypothetical protein
MSIDQHVHPSYNLQPFGFSIGFSMDSAFRSIHSTQQVIALSIGIAHHAPRPT